MSGKMPDQTNSDPPSPMPTVTVTEPIPEQSLLDPPADSEAQAVKEAARLAAKDQADKEAIEAREKDEKDEKEAADLAAKEQAEKNTADLAAKESADREAAELAAKQETEDAARERVETFAAVLAAKEQADKQAAELAAKQQADNEAEVVKPENQIVDSAEAIDKEDRAADLAAKAEDNDSFKRAAVEQQVEQERRATFTSPVMTEKEQVATKAADEAQVLRHSSSVKRPVFIEIAEVVSAPAPPPSPMPRAAPKVSFVTTLQEKAKRAVHALSLSQARRPTKTKETVDTIDMGLARVQRYPFPKLRTALFGHSRSPEHKAASGFIS